MTDQELESLLGSLDAPAFAPGHQARLAVRMVRHEAAAQRERFSAREVVASRRDERHQRRGRPLSAWFALAAMLGLAAALALRSPRPRGFDPTESDLPQWAVAAEPLVVKADLFASRRWQPAIDIRRWSTHSGASR